MTYNSKNYFNTTSITIYKCIGLIVIIFFGFSIHSLKESKDPLSLNIKKCVPSITPATPNEKDSTIPGPSNILLHVMIATFMVMINEVEKKKPSQY